MPLHDSILIERRFCGPPASANGGYAAGRLAAALGEGIEHPVQVRLHRPPPLDVPLTVNQQATDTAQLTNRGELLATATRTTSDPPPFAPASLRQAELASQPLDPDQHPFPHCFVCGPLREHRDGLRIFPGPIPHTDTFAAVWTPDQNLSSNGSQVPSEFVWAALDCASGVPLLLATQTADLRPGDHHRPRPSEPSRRRTAHRDEQSDRDRRAQALQPSHAVHRRRRNLRDRLRNLDRARDTQQTMNPQLTCMIVQSRSAELRRKARSLSVDTPAPAPHHRPGPSNRASRTMRWLANHKLLTSALRDVIYSRPPATYPVRASLPRPRRMPLPQTATNYLTFFGRSKGTRAGARNAPSETRPWISPTIGSGPTEGMRAAPVNPLARSTCGGSK